MNKEIFEYKPLANNKNDRCFRWDVKNNKDIPEDALYMKMGNINSHVVRYVVIWGEHVTSEGSAYDLKPVSGLG